MLLFCFVVTILHYNKSYLSITSVYYLWSILLFMSYDFSIRFQEYLKDLCPLTISLSTLEPSIILSPALKYSALSVFIVSSLIFCINVLVYWINRFKLLYPCLWLFDRQRIVECIIYIRNPNSHAQNLFFQFQKASCK